MAVGTASTIISDDDGNPLDLMWYLERWSKTNLSHIVLRGTFLPNTVRCDYDGRYVRFQPYINHYGWLEINSVKCYVDVRVNEYILGSGPPILTVLRFQYAFGGGTPERIETIRSTIERLFIEGGSETTSPRAMRHDFYVSEGGIGGIEQILFIGPSSDASAETWEVFDTWSLEQREDGTVVAIHPYAGSWQQLDPELYEEKRSTLFEPTLATLKTGITTAHNTRSAESGGKIAPATETYELREGAVWPSFQTDGNMLSAFYAETGADMHEDGPPETPPAPCGLSVSDQLDNAPLVKDCQVLLEAKDTLRGSGSLDWSTGTAIANWEGITVAGTPMRVTKLELANKSLNGSIPAGLADLDALNTIKLAGNTLTGCIPAKLKDIATNDLSSLNLPYCSPTPEGLQLSPTSANSLSLRWTTITGVSKYRVESRKTGDETWGVADDTLTTGSYEVSGLSCGTYYDFRVSAYGDGTAYQAAWSDPSSLAREITHICVTPVFPEESYAFSVFDNVDSGAAVGTVEATDPNGDALSYSITAGNGDGKFSIGASTGAITVAGSLDHEVTSTYTLTVEASDGSNTASVSVVITVKEGNDPPVFPEGGYTFPIHESVGRFTAVGFAKATDPNGDVVTYAITGGNVGNKFFISHNNGLINVGSALSYANRSSYSLTVRATDARGATADGTVTINVVQAATGTPPPPTSLRTTLKDDGDLIISYDEVPNTSMNRLRYRTAPTGQWTTLSAVGQLVRSQTISDTTCGVTYEVQAQAQGNGVTYTAEWGDWSDTVSTEVPLCPAPAFENLMTCQWRKTPKPATRLGPSPPPIRTRTSSPTASPRATTTASSP